MIAVDQKPLFVAEQIISVLSDEDFERPEIQKILTDARELDDNIYRTYPDDLGMDLSTKLQKEKRK